MRNILYECFLKRIFLIVTHKQQDKAMDAMNKMEEEEREEEEFHKIIPIFLNRNDKNKE